ncbi:Mic1 domain-containing protein [Meloidogyne graminicola]|uniref:Mic1 domain-containing protein n=1 Tax=Meloidogyne graminicola TaxID=189291 RepID=A0A8S9ZE97_9BILA|nr:Mic1 domain-containing protein [Meloidogyne graminicola]
MVLTLGASFIQYNEGNDKDTKLNGLFFDPISERCCAVQNNVTETLFRLSSLDKSCSEVFFRSRRRNKIRLLCFSSDLSAAVIQQEDSILDFLLFANGCVTAEFQQHPKFFKDSSFILGVSWMADRQLAMATEEGIEFCSLNVHRKSLKLLKSFNHPSSWFICFPQIKLFLLASSIINNSLHLISFQNSMLFDIGNINVDFGCSEFKPRLLERDVSICPIYGRVCLLVLRFEPSNGLANGLTIFEFLDERQPMSLPQLKCLLKFDLFGLVGVQVVDNLVLVHHKNCCRTLVFDIKHSTDRCVFCSSLYVTDPLSKYLRGVKSVNETDATSIFAYNSAWKMIQYKGFIIDMQFGIFTQVQLDLNKAVDLIENLVDNLINFLINRTDSESILLDLLQRIILRKEMKFTKMTRILRKILYNPETGDNQSHQKAGKSMSLICFYPHFVNHNSILRCIFEPLYSHLEMDKRYLANLMIDFFLSLKQRKIQIQNHYLPELLLKIVADAKMWTCLHQLLQYRVIDDSKFLVISFILKQSYL